MRFWRKKKQSWPPPCETCGTARIYNPGTNLWACPQCLPSYCFITR